MPDQLTLGVTLRDDATFANFYPVANQELLLQLQRLIKGEGEAYLYLWGQAGVGVSHLLQACCHHMNELSHAATYLPMQQAELWSPYILENLDMLDLVCIDDIEAIAGVAVWEEALFHLYNHISNTNTRLLVAGHKPPNQLGLHLADLVSRLNWGMVFQVQELIDEDKLFALQLHAQSRGLKLSREVAQFLLRRCTRDMRQLCDVLQRLDHASLAAQRRLTIPFVKDVLKV